jgi:hypothetical protein
MNCVGRPSESTGPLKSGLTVVFQLVSLSLFNTLTMVNFTYGETDFTSGTLYVTATSNLCEPANSCVPLPPKYSSCSVGGLA